MNRNGVIQAVLFVFVLWAIVVSSMVSTLFAQLYL